MELLAPAGNLEKLKTAFLYGADACYMGVRSMSMRVRENEIGSEALEEALRLKDELGKKLYLTMNIHAHESRLNFLAKEIDYLKQLHKKKLNPDGILVSDIGILAMLQKECPWLPIHISTQANTLNSEAIEFWAKQKGVTRVVLGREVSLRELQKIRTQLKKKKIDVELESFGHGAMCMAYSGRCLLSSFMSYRSANEGMCAHSCRWKYKVHEVGPKAIKHPDGKEYYLEEDLRPGEFIPIEENQDGTYIMSAKDMCMIEHLKDLIDVGLDSLKIEGRNKTVYYIALVTRAYRQALDLAAKNKPLTPEILELIDSIDTRGYHTGFWYGKPGAKGQKYEDRSDYNDNFCFAGVIRNVKNKTITMEVRNTLKKGDQLDIITPTKNISLTLTDFKNAKTNELIEIAHPGQKFAITFDGPSEIEKGFVVRKCRT